MAETINPQARSLRSPLVTLNGTGNLFAVSSPNVLTKNGAGTVTFNGANTYVAATVINAGTIVSGTPAALPLTIGFLEITSAKALSVSAIYTASDPKSGSLSVRVEQIKESRS